MKCDDCNNMIGEGASIECPWPQVYCSKGHWEGLGPEYDDPNFGAGHWEDCKDFEEKKVYVSGGPPKRENKSSPNPSGVIVKTRNKERGNATLDSLKDLFKNVREL